jgi:NAD(P)-dependent dehydrogenase (short-subunit alcohol dehydrogenase family)
MLIARGHGVIAACRSASPALVESGAEVVQGVDVTSSLGIATLVDAVGKRPVDLLINNAGILIWGDELGALNVEGIR